jgi:hypothetical protein
MDVMLVSKDGKRIAFIESKFTEHLSRAASELYGQRFASAYANKDRYYKECCAEKWGAVVNNWKGYAQNGKVCNEAMRGYYNGIKQDICHLIAIGNLESSPAAREAFATKNKKTFGAFDISGIDFDFINLVYEPNKGKYSKEYERCVEFKELCQKFFDDVKKTIKTVPKFCTYSELWNDKDNSSMMSSVESVSSDETLKKFLERRYMQFSSAGE